MSYEWQRSSNMPDFTRSGNDVATGGGRLTVLVVVLAILGALVLFSAFSYAPTGTENGASAPAAVDGATGTGTTTD
ncbi:hypothetical protein [Roseovarius sp.]|uniref:hypothetical protein n=1 Tax=Roseovarius sp. TaxID=1486281 RepID=UPI00261CC3EB|nr:hypothetical protein [Roseovarius sp.]MDM8165268.1 hypothetical protein [Roseovarius sp.]